MAKAFYWDEIEGEVAAITADLPEGCTPRQGLILFDDAIEQQCSVTEGGGTRNKQVFQRQNVYVLEATFGPHDHVTRIYWAPNGDDMAAEELATIEMQCFFIDKQEG